MPRIQLAAVLLVAGLTGCPLNHSSTLSSSSSPPAASSAPSSASTSAFDPHVPPEHGHPGRIIRSQLVSLRGLSPDEAKAQLKRWGHEGQVSLGVVRDSGGGETFIQACGVNKVCETSGDSGIGLHDNLELELNPTVSIAPPPP